MLEVVGILKSFYSFPLTSRAFRETLTCLQQGREVYLLFFFFFFSPPLQMAKKSYHFWKAGNKINRVEEKNRKDGKIWGNNKRPLIS